MAKIELSQMSKAELFWKVLAIKKLVLYSVSQSLFHFFNFIYNQTHKAGSLPLPTFWLQIPIVQLVCIFTTKQG